MRRRHQLIGLGVLYIAGLLAFAFTSPDSLPVGLLIIPFIYLFVVLYLTGLVFSNIADFKQSKTVSILGASLGTLLFVLGSLNQLGIRDVLISLALVLLLSWYLQKQKST